MPGVGYVLYTYKDPEQIMLLVHELLRADDTRAIAIHHDANSGPLDRFTDDERVDILEDPGRVRWAHWSQVEAIVRATKRMLERNAEVDWIVLLTGQDWPVVPVEHVGRALAALDVDACIDAGEIGDMWGWDALRRYGYRWYDVPKPLRRLTRLLEAANSVRGLAYLRHYGKTEVQLIGVRSSILRRRSLCGGSEYFMMNRLAWSAVVDFYERNTAERRAIARTLVPTETFFATAIARRGLRVGPSRRYMRFVVGRSNPELLEPSDARRAVDQGCLFARKVGPDDVLEFRDEVRRIGE